jgi:uncharacterized protein (UPF0264 family)
MSLAGIEPAISESDCRKPTTLDHAATGIGVATINFLKCRIYSVLVSPEDTTLIGRISDVVRSGRGSHLVA